MTTLKEFGFNDLCDYFEELRCEYQRMLITANLKIEAKRIKQYKLWEFGICSIPSEKDEK